jgi:hypothetical protein
MQGNGTVWGLVVRNNLSEVIYAATKKCNLDVEALVAETLGLRWIMQVAHDLNLSKVLFEMANSCNRLNYELGHIHK